MSDKNVAKKVERLQDKHAQDAVTVALSDQRGPDLTDVNPRQQGVMDEQFPTNSLRAPDKLDKVMDARIELGDDEGRTPFGKMVLEDKHLKWLQKKQAAEETANFQAWFAREFDHMSPAEKKRAKELYPAFYSQRMKLLGEQTNNLKDLARIKLNGAENFSDLMKQYAAETGRLDVGPLEHLLNPEQAQGTKAQNEAKFRRGLLNPWRVFGEEAFDTKGKQNVAERGKQSAAFATRSNANVKYGVEGTGFPPFGNRLAPEGSTDQGTKSWYEMLANGP
jgi:hypothetical protein